MRFALLDQKFDLVSELFLCEIFHLHFNRAQFEIANVFPKCVKLVTEEA